MDGVMTRSPARGFLFAWGMNEAMNEGRKQRRGLDEQGEKHPTGMCGGS